MKKYIIMLISAFALIMSCNKDEDKWSDAMKDADVGAAMPYAYFNTPKFFDIANMDQAFVEFTLNVNATKRAKNYRRVVLEKSFKGGAWVLHKEYLPADLPATVKITLDDALAGITGVTKETLAGGDYFDWRFIMDVPDTVVFQAELAGTLPNFRSYMASAPVGFTVEGSYTMDLIYDDSELGTSQIEGYQITLVPGTAKSEYILQDITCGFINNFFGVGNVANKLYYIGDNKFAIKGASEGWPTLIRLAGTVERDPSTGIITVDVTFVNSCCGLNGIRMIYTLTPED